MFDVIEGRTIPVDWSSKQLKTWRKPTGARDVTKNGRQRLLKLLQQSLTSPQRPFSLEWTIYKLRYSLFSCTFVMLTFILEHLVSVLLIFFDCAPYYFANHRQNYKFCYISILSNTKKVSVWISSSLHSKWPVPGVHLMESGPKSRAEGKKRHPSFFFLAHFSLHRPSQLSERWNRLRFSLNLSPEMVKQSPLLKDDKCTLSSSVHLSTPLPWPAVIENKTHTASLKYQRQRILGKPARD